MEWNTQKKIWQLSTDGLLFEHWEPFLGTWQISGTMRNGLVYELPMPEHHTSVSESSLLRSPTASQGEGGALGEEEARKRGNTVGIRDNAMDIARLNGHKVSRVEANLLPTPITRDYKDGSAAQTRDGKTSTDTVARAIFNSGEVTLPTPTASDWKGANNSGSGSASSNGLATKIDNLETDWGKFEPAIRRWEDTLGRPAPLPTKPDGKDGAHRLSSAFTEWMMGLPEGWVTNVGLTRNEELKACGNGVVPQQAELALRVLLEGVAFEKFQGGMTMFPTPTVSDTYTDNLSSTQQKDGSMHSVTLPQAVRMVGNAAN
jgi:DNA (cytosine-5)-methyltransferase 1